MVNKDILNDLDKEDTNEFIESDVENKKSKEETFNSFDKINITWDRFTKEVITFFQKSLKKKKSMKEYENSETNKHEEIFKILIKYFMLLVFISFIMVLIVAFFKVFIFSREIVNSPERTKITKEASGIDFNIDSSYSWETKTTEDVKNNSRNIEAIRESIEKQNKVTEDNNIILKNFIKKSNNDIGLIINKSLKSLKSDMYSYVEQTKTELKKDIKRQVKNIKIAKEQSITDSIINLPKSVVAITKKLEEKYKDGTIKKNETKVKQKLNKIDKPLKKQIIEKIAINDREIYTSINIETVISDMSGYDENNKTVTDKNNTLPPVILRQGMSNGVLVTGISAPTFEMDKNPAAVFLTFKGKSIISNMFEQDVENCTATGSVFGNIITRRAEILVNKISCTYTQDGKQYMVRSNVKAWVYDGYDGRLGIPGILVDNSGAILNDSMIIGMLQGFGKFVSSSAQIYGQQGMSTINATGIPTYSAAQVAQTNMMAGMGEQLASGFDTITDYYQRIIDTLYPYIDVKGGRKISIFFDGGEVLTPVVYTPFLVNDNHDTSNNSDDYDMEVEVSLDDW